MFENSTEKKFIIATMIIAIPLSLILFSITKPILAIIFSVLIILGLLLLLVHKIAVKKDKYSEVAKDEGYESDNENEKQNTKISAEEQERIQAELEIVGTSNNEGLVTEISAEEQKRIQTERAKKYMKPNSELKDDEKLSNHSIDGHGDQVTSRAQEQEKPDCNQLMPSLSEHINVVGAPISSKAQGVENGYPVEDTQVAEVSQDKSYWAEKMPSLPVNMNRFDRAIPLDQPLSVLEIVQRNVNIFTKSTDTGADIAAKMRAPSTILI